MLKDRIVSGLILGLGFPLATWFLPPWAIWLVLVAVAVLAQLEFYRLMDRADMPVFRIVGTLSGAALISATVLALSRPVQAGQPPYPWEHLVMVVSLMAVFIRQFPQKHNEKPLQTIACTLLGICYVPYLLGFFARLLFTWDPAVGDTGRQLVIYAIVVIKITDIGAYFTGRFLGRHKMFPRLSPKKTWEGLFGGILAAVAASIAAWRISGGALGVVRLSMLDAVAIGLLLAVSGVVGDLFESLLKRAAGSKDSSAVIPGMGGLLDVLDSLLFGAPALYVYLQVFAR